MPLSHENQAPEKDGHYGGSRSCQGRAEQMLPDQQALLRAVLDTAGVLVVVLDREGRITRFNRACEVATGYSASEAVGLVFWDLLVPEEDLEGVRQTWDSIVAGAFPNTHENRLVARDGSCVFVAWSNTAITSPSGEIEQVVATGLDITERKQAELRQAADVEALTRIHALSRRLVETTGLQSLLQEVMDAAVFIMKADLGTLQLLEGDSLRIVAHRGHQDFFLEFFASAETRASVCGEAMKRGERIVVADIECCPLFIGTESLPVLRQAGVRAVQSTPLISRRGKLLGVLTTQWSTPHCPDEHDLWRVDLLTRQAADLIEYAQTDQFLVESNQRLESLMRALPVGVSFSDDSTCQRITGNPAVLAQFEVTSNDNLSASAPNSDTPGRKVLFFLDGRPISDTEMPLQRAVAENKEMPTVQLEVHLPSGRVWFADTSAAPVRDKQGNVIGGVAVTVDVTQRIVLEQQRRGLLDAERIARSEAEKAVRIKDEFLATISHELRNPLNALMGWTQLLAKGGVPVSKAVDIIRKNVSTLAQIVADLLDMSRIVSGKAQLAPEPTDLAALIGNVIDGVRVAADAKQIGIEPRLDPELSPITCDPSRIQQVFHNLLSNAVKFTPQGGHVVVSCSQTLKHVEISVQDNGEGIPIEFLPHVFDRFRQADQSTTRRHTGLGLGLTITKHLVELHGGTVRAESEGVGRGATLIVSLPRTNINSAWEAANELPRRQLVNEMIPESDDVNGATRNLSVLRFRKCLIVDDDIDNCEFVARILEDCGAVTRWATSGEQGLKLLMEFLPDLLISDIGMPGMNDYELVRRVRANGGAFASLLIFARTM